MDSLTPSEQRIFTNGMICAFEGLNNIKVDYEKLAQMSGLKNGACASVLFNKAKRKFIQLQGGESSVSPKKVATPEKVVKKRTPRKNTGKTKIKAGDDSPTETYPGIPASDGDSAETTPSKPAGRGKRAATKKIKAEEGIGGNAPIDLINNSIKLEDGNGYTEMISDFGERAIDDTDYAAVKTSPHPSDYEDLANLKTEVFE